MFTLNPDHIYHLQRNRRFLEAYLQAAFITSDSKYVYWGLKWLGRPIKEKVSGSEPRGEDFATGIAITQISRCFFLAPPMGVAQLALERINRRAGRPIVVGAHSPSMNFVNDKAEIEATLELIRSSRANVLIVGLGAPKQEIWIVDHRIACRM